MPIAIGCMASRTTGKLLRIAVDGVWRARRRAAGRARAAMARENKLLARVSKTKFAVVGKRTAKFWRSRLFVMRFDWDYLVIACSLAVIGAAFILFLAM